MAIAVKNITKEYKRGKRSFKAVDDVSLGLHPGDFIVIIGKSGSGKSTLLNIIAGLTYPTDGRVEADESNIFTLTDKQISRYRNQTIGYIPQGHSTLADLNVVDNVRLPFHLNGEKRISADKAEELLTRVGIHALAKNFPKHLSGGELKRVAIARALINDPEAIIADEPTSDLDKQTTAEVLTLLRSVAEGGKAVLMVTHDLDAVKYATRSFVMESGVLTEQKKEAVLYV
ncbi:MAG: ABC transporter ATP-binding protein [Clostridiales bacterium 43-6]|nr:MAG: ABC transporter ATP-binding protein [Clostridiales bacterium 43-6]